MRTTIKRDLEGMEPRRRQGLRRLAQGLGQAEVARRCGVSRVSVWRWAQQQQSSDPGAWKRRPLGRRPKLKAPDLRRLDKALLQGAQVHGFLNDLWSLSRVAEVIRCLGGSASIQAMSGGCWGG